MNQASQDRAGATILTRVVRTRGGQRGTRLIRKPGIKNRTEADFEAEMLTPRLMAGELEWVGFEAITLKLAPDCRYTPDFVTLDFLGQLEVWEVKGFWREDAKVKLRVAAQSFDFLRFYVVTRGKKGEPRWKVEAL